jgi:hypothetical protein
MKAALISKYYFTLICVVCVASLFSAACSQPAKKDSLKGVWKSTKAGTNQLRISDKKFALDNDESLAEDYFVKNDTIFTSFDGNQPYSKFVVQKLDDHNLELLSPDSALMEFTR